jgi:hypothetical protein
LTPPLLWPAAASLGASRVPPSSCLAIPLLFLLILLLHPLSMSLVPCLLGHVFGKGGWSRDQQRFPCNHLSLGSGDGKETQKA